jgi:hypothetical protein
MPENPVPTMTMGKILHVASFVSMMIMLSAKCHCQYVVSRSC